MIMHELVVYDDKYDIVMSQDDGRGMVNEIRIAVEQVPILKDWLDCFAKKIVDGVDDKDES